jgi:predicted GIY-YIG superfamily endonuclease
VPKRLVYVLESLISPSRHYVGLTSDVTERLAAHNSGGCPSTSRHRPWKVLAAVEFADPALAARFEKYLKSGSGRAFAKRHF